MLKVWRWDEVDDEVDTAELPHVDENSPAHLVIAADKQLNDVEPSEYDREMVTEFPGFTLVTMRWGRDRQYAIWWGRDAHNFANFLKINQD